MTRRIALTFLVCAGSIGAEVRTLTLRESVDLALRQNPELTVSRLNEQIAGQSLPGTGCLQVLLYANIVWVVFWCMIIGSFMGIGMFAN